MPINLTRKSLNADYTGNYFQNTILIDFIKYNNIKKSMKGMINMKKILILAIMVLGLNTNVFAWYDMLEAMEADKIVYSKKPSEMTKKDKKLLKKYGYDLNYDYSAIRNRKEDNVNNTKDENKKADCSEGKLKNE